MPNTTIFIYDTEILVELKFFVQDSTQSFDLIPECYYEKNCLYDDNDEKDVQLLKDSIISKFICENVNINICSKKINNFIQFKTSKIVYSSFYLNINNIDNIKMSQGLKDIIKIYRKFLKT